MVTGKPFQGVYVDTNAMRLVAPRVSKAAVVWVASGVPSR